MTRVKIIFLLLTCIVTEHQVMPIASMIGDVATVANFANDALAFFKGELPLENLIMGSTGYALEQILEKVGEISQSLENMEANNERRMNHIISTLMNRLPLQSRVDSGMVELHEYIVRIDGLYEHFNQYIKKRATFNNYTMMNFITANTSHRKGDIFDILDNLYRLMMPGRTGGFKTGLPELVRQNNMALDFSERCGSGSSVQQRLYEIYNAVVISESRAFTMIVFSYAMLMAYKKASFTAEIEKAGSQLVLRSEEYIIATERAMTNSSKVVDRCDPKVYRRGKNFYELEGAIQMYVVHEPDVVSDGVCTGTCEDVWIGYTRGCFDGENYCRKRDCLGWTTNCWSASTSTLCELEHGNRKRLDWFEDKWGTVYGDRSSCSGTTMYPSGWTRGFVFCDVCVCDCWEQKAETPALRTICLRPQISNIGANMVVVGVKFVQKDRMMMLQIAEAELLSGGRINGGTEVWKDLESFEYREEGYGGKFYLIEGDKKLGMEHNDDYAFIRKYQHTMHLDDVEAPHDYVVTGIRFMNEGKDSETWNETPLQIRIRVTPFDFYSGNLTTDPEKSYWMNAADMKDPPLAYSYKRNEVTLEEPHDPTLTSKTNTASLPNQFIRFRSSDRSKDAGQSTVPFFDGQPVLAQPLSPLTGIGIYHRGIKGSGGFLAPRLITLDIPGYLQTKLSEDMVARYKPKYDGSLPYPI